MALQRTCRICGLIKVKTKNLYKSKLSNEIFFLHEAFTFVTSINANHGDRFPDHICTSCLKRLTDAYYFKRQAEKTHLTFEKQTRELKFKKELEQQHEEPVKPYCNMQLRAPNDIDKSVEELKDEFSTDMNSFAILISNDSQESELKESKQNQANINGTSRNEVQKNIKHSCQVCGRTFLRKSNLVDHLRLHANLRPFQCKYCDKSFVQIANYRTHLRIHTKERPYKCDICTKSFNQSGSLKIHIRYHTQERNYFCNECGKAFTNSSDLNKHIRVHSPDLQFKCDFCDKLFAQKHNLRKHRQKVHQIEFEKM